ncbi:MAG: DNA-3-methyladenine glycosylase [Chlorobi bacterium]|nr:DNA-3-methyladenine glycosylase [Chlorobiota bacterium]
MKLHLSYYKSDDVVGLAKDLIGKELFTNINGIITSGIISETEAYAGATDKASHAYGGRRTKRTETMYKPGGRTYVYLCYGIHYLLNIVTAGKDQADAVLIRGIIPRTGIEAMYARSKKHKLKGLSDGPAKVCKVLGVNISHNDLMLDSNRVWIEDNNFDAAEYTISISRRIGIDYAGEDAKLPYRFLLRVC